MPVGWHNLRKLASDNHKMLSFREGLNGDPRYSFEVTQMMRVPCAEPDDFDPLDYGSSDPDAASNSSLSQKRKLDFSDVETCDSEHASHKRFELINLRLLLWE